MIRLNKIFDNQNKFINFLNSYVIPYVKYPFINDNNYNNMILPFNSWYYLLDFEFGSRFIRYDQQLTFLKRLANDFIDYLPNLYKNQVLFLQNEIKTYLSSAENRTIKIKKSFTETKQGNNTNRSGTGDNIDYIATNNVADITDFVINTANINGNNYLDNHSYNDNIAQFDFLEQVKKALDANFTLQIYKFFKRLEKHFISILTERVEAMSVVFRNGYYVADVDYLGLANKSAIEQLAETIKKYPNNEQINLIKQELINKIEINKNSVIELKNYVNQEIQKIQNDNTGLHIKVDKNTSLINTTQLTVAENKVNIQTLLNDVSTLKSNVKQNTINIKNYITQDRQAIFHEITNLKNIDLDLGNGIKKCYDDLTAEITKLKAEIEQLKQNNQSSPSLNFGPYKKYSLVCSGVYTNAISTNNYQFFELSANVPNANIIDYYLKYENNFINVNPVNFNITTIYQKGNYIKVLGFVNLKITDELTITNKINEYCKNLFLILRTA